MAEVVETAIKEWGHGLALRLTRPMARAVGVTDGTVVKVTAEPGRLVVELAERRMTLAERLERFDPARHGGELMELAPVSREL